MDKKVIDFFCKDEYLKKCYEDGLDIYSSFASKIFNVPYEDCCEFKEGQAYLPGGARRSSAKAILCACYVSQSNEQSPFYWLNRLDMFLPILSRK